MKKHKSTSTERTRAEKYLNSVGSKAGECIVLEDSENGIKAASKAKMLPVLVPDIRRPDEVEKLVYRELIF